MEVKLKEEFNRKPAGAIISVSSDRAYYMMKIGLVNEDSGFMAEYEAANKVEEKPPADAPAKKAAPKKAAKKAPAKKKAPKKAVKK